MKWVYYHGLKDGLGLCFNALYVMLSEMLGENMDSIIGCRQLCFGILDLEGSCIFY